MCRKLITIRDVAEQAQAVVAWWVMISAASG